MATQGNQPLLSGKPVFEGEEKPLTGEETEEEEEEKKPEKGKENVHKTPKPEMDDIEEPESGKPAPDIWDSPEPEGRESSEDFLEENKELIKKVNNILTLIYPDSGVTIAELLESSSGYLSGYAGSGGTGTGTGTVKNKTAREYVEDLKEFAKENWIRPVLIDDCPRSSISVTIVNEKEGKEVEERITHKPPYNSDLNLGASRANGTRNHAGNDYYVYTTGKKVYAITDGIVLKGPYDFLYQKEKVINKEGILFKKDAIDIESTDGTGTIIRYGELKFKEGLKEVKRGDEIGEIIRNRDGAKKIRGGFMLHLEIYMGKDLKGKKIKYNGLTKPENQEYLYVPKKNYRRRKDLIDPEFVNDLPDLKEKEQSKKEQNHNS